MECAHRNIIFIFIIYYIIIFIFLLWKEKYSQSKVANLSSLVNDVNTN